ncbi:MAG: DUF493 family protein [Gammaproteobacteria bacterium]|jgi:putative lipoic acid-binding regulatory protein|nr:DUF493 family protein [Gammaproteobacteria bacterium]
MTIHEDSLLEFPCDFPIKVMGRDEGDDFRSEAVAIVEAEIGPLAEDAVTTQPSRNGRFLSVTVTVRAESREQLDSLYRRLSSSERVLVVL